MNREQADKIIEELTLLRLEVTLQTDAARETQATVQAIADKYAGPGRRSARKQTACEWLRKEGALTWPVN